MSMRILQEAQLCPRTWWIFGKLSFPHIISTSLVSIFNSSVFHIIYWAIFVILNTYTAWTVFFMFFPPCAYTMCYVLIAFIQPFPIYQALFAQYYIFAAAATTWNPSSIFVGISSLPTIDSSQRNLCLP